LPIHHSNVTGIARDCMQSRGILTRKSGKMRHGQYASVTKNEVKKPPRPVV
jgi:hypothetical protein